MKYHILERLWIGCGIGTMIGVAITVLLSYILGDGAYLPVMPHLAALFQRETDGVVVQFLLFALIGAVFAEAGIVFWIEKWSFFRKCLTHFCITSVFFIPFLWLCYFSQTSVWKFLLIPGNIFLSYMITWLISYFSMRAEIGTINKRIEEMRNVK